MKRRPFRFQVEEAGIDEVVIQGLIHIEAMDECDAYVVSIGSGKAERRFYVSDIGRKLVVMEQD